MRKLDQEILLLPLQLRPRNSYRSRLELASILKQSAKQVNITSPLCTTRKPVACRGTPKSQVATLLDLWFWTKRSKRSQVQSGRLWKIDGNKSASSHILALLLKWMWGLEDIVSVAGKNSPRARRRAQVAAKPSRARGGKWARVCELEMFTRLD